MRMSQIKKERFNDFNNRENLSKAHQFESKPIYQIDFDGNIIAEQPSANWASKILGMNQTRIYEALNHLNRKRHMEILYGFIQIVMIRKFFLMLDGI